MSSWDQRGKYLVNVSQRCLKGHKTFDLCRSHLVQASQISKGTIYNHFNSEADLIVAVGCDQLERWLTQARNDSEVYLDPYTRFIYHHCQRLYSILSEKMFVIERVLPNDDILSKSSDAFQEKFKTLAATYYHWNADAIKEIGEINGFDRVELVIQYLRGALINIDDAQKQDDSPELYHQLSYALTQLIGHSNKRIPALKDFKTWLLTQGLNRNVSINLS
jgi:AcrR family transcriptional regulator